MSCTLNTYRPGASCRRTEILRLRFIRLPTLVPSYGFAAAFTCFKWSATWPAAIPSVSTYNHIGFCVLSLNQSLSRRHRAEYQDISKSRRFRKTTLRDSSRKRRILLSKYIIQISQLMTIGSLSKRYQKTYSQYKTIW